MYYLYAGIIGLAGGFLSAVFGIGGGVVMVPAMMFFMGLDIKVAAGTSLAVIIPTAVVGVFKHQGHELVDWRVALSLAPTAICGSLLGATVLPLLDSQTLKRSFGGFLVLVGLKLIFGK
jgi:uncharacterized membrane protein YfcA